MDTLNKKLQKIIDDTRYTAAIENGNKYVLRFCNMGHRNNGGFVGEYASENDLMLGAIIHQDDRGYQLLN